MVSKDLTNQVEKRLLFQNFEIVHANVKVQTNSQCSRKTIYFASSKAAVFSLYFSVMLYWVKNYIIISMRAAHWITHFNFSKLKLSFKNSTLVLKAAEAFGAYVQSAMLKTVWYL